MSSPENPPAFPSKWMEDNGFGVQYPCGPDGMDLRDWFAGQALAGVVLQCASDTRLGSETIEHLFARKAYLLADAMLALRVREGGAA